MPTYTVKNVKPTGKAPHDTYGTEYHVQFEEDERVLKISRKNEVNVGDTMEGDITEGKYGAMFKKAPFVPGQREGAAPAATDTQSGKPFTKSTYKDNSDGMRQGMCINNAAAYVAATVTDVQTPEEWSKAVFAYANALYLKGDLGAPVKVTDEVAGVTEEPVNLDAVAAMFGA